MASKTSDRSSNPIFNAIEKFFIVEKLILINNNIKKVNLSVKLNILIRNNISLTRTDAAANQAALGFRGCKFALFMAPLSSLILVGISTGRRSTNNS